MRLINLFFKDLIYGSHIQSISAASIVYLSAIHLGQNLLILIFVYFLLQAIYLYDRYLHLEFDSTTNKERSEHLGRYKDKMAYLVLGNGLVALIGFFSLSTYFGFIAAVTLLLGFAYPHRVKLLTKRIPLLKNFYVASVLALLVYFPFFFIKDNPPMATHIFAIFIFWESVYSQIFLDLKDVKADKSLRLQTLPVLIGSAKTLGLLSSVFVLLGLTFPIVFYMLGRTEFFIVSGLAVVLNFLFVSRYKNTKPSYVYVSGKFMFLAVLTSIFRFFVV